MKEKMPKTEEEWKSKLSSEQCKILREKGTEIPFTGKYVHSKEDGTFLCAACGNPIFSSESKFDSGTGWPSFDTALPGSVERKTDESHGMTRTEIVCSQCGSHLGHVFNDGPTETGERYCVNSVCLDLEKEK